MARLEGLLYAATMQTNLLNHFGAPLGESDVWYHQ